MKKRAIILAVVVMAVLLSSCGKPEPERGISVFQSDLNSLENSTFHEFFSSIEHLADNAIGESTKSLSSETWHIGTNNPYFHARFTIAGKSTGITLSFPDNSDIIDSIEFFMSEIDSASFSDLVDAAAEALGEPLVVSDGNAYWDSVMIMYFASTETANIVITKFD